MLVMRCYFELDLGTSEIEVDKLSEMKQKIENLGISCDFTSPGQYIVLTCPKVILLVLVQIAISYCLVRLHGCREN